MNEETSLRIDKWLWAARFYKTRALATEAVAGGKVHVNGERVKPARKVVAGDELVIRKGTIEMAIVIKGINHQRRPAVEAQQLYEETPESIRKREEFKLASKAQPFIQSHSKVDKKSRRESIRMKRGP